MRGCGIRGLALACPTDTITSNREFFDGQSLSLFEPSGSLAEGLAAHPVRARPSVRATGADDLGDRLERALDDGLALLALTLDERAIILASLEDPPEGLAELGHATCPQFGLLS